MTEQQNIIKDLATISDVPAKALLAIVDKINLCIGSAIHEGLTNNADALQLNIGPGILYISLPDMQCKFIPSKELKAIIKTSISTKINPLEEKLDASISAKLIKISEDEI